MRKVDLRSDTVTLPSPAMREAMYHAELGDDVFGEDPTVNKLQEMAAERLGKEAALLVASGTMGNLVGQLTHCGRGDEIILGEISHIFLYEQGGMSALGGIHSRPVSNLPNGMLDLQEVEEAVRADNIHFPRTRLICVENTHNRCHGSPLTVDQMNQIAAVAQKYGLATHLDGARIFNAATALDVDVKDLVAGMDSVQFCLSKGLAAPVGSLICGSQGFIDEALRNRKVVGGGMRQAGIIAAAGIVALEEMVDRMADDHENARLLAENIAAIKGLDVDLDRVSTNIVYFDLVGSEMETEDLVSRLNDQGVRVLPTGPARIRAVTHYGVDRQDIDYASTVIKQIMEA
jgi:threonine aldolase